MKDEKEQKNRGMQQKKLTEYKQDRFNPEWEFVRTIFQYFCPD